MTLSAKTDKRRISRSVLVFATHQLLATFGVAVFAYLLGIFVFNLAALLGAAPSMRPLHHILTETPYFPVQIALGFWFGWYLAKYLRHRAMVYVWVVPFLILTYALLAVPTLSPGLNSVIFQRSSRLSHYFGWGCQPKDRCVDQIVVTMPFYAATSYSLGAWLALKAKLKGRAAAQESAPIKKADPLS